jgi:OOP family OmpA-OmpF porin
MSGVNTMKAIKPDHKMRHNMRKRKPFFAVDAIKKSALLLVVSAVIFPVSAHSGLREGSVELSPFIGYNFFESQQNLEDSPVYGGRLGYNFTKHFGIEGVGEYTRSKVDDKTAIHTEEGQFTSPISTVKITRYHLDLLYHFMPEKKFNPFIAGGYGFAHYRPEINSRDMAIFNLGVGAKYWLADDVALRVDLRDHLLYDEGIHDLQATVGIVFAFGGKSTPAPVAAVRHEAKPQPTPPPALVAKKKVIILASEPEAEKKILLVEAEPKIIILAFEDVSFDFDQSTLTPEAKKIMKRNIQLLKENPKAEIRVAGYTSAAGTEEYNQKLSERRAEAVRTYLVEEGIVDPDRLSTIGYGEDDPASFEAAPKELYSDAAKSNMRVLFEIIVQ